MTAMNIVRTALVRVSPAAFVLMIAMPASAQGGYGNNRNQSTSAVSTTEIQRLQDQVYDASNEVSRLRSRDQALADRLQSQLDDLRPLAERLAARFAKVGKELHLALLQRSNEQRWSGHAPTSMALIFTNPRPLPEDPFRSIFTGHSTSLIRLVPLRA